MAIKWVQVRVSAVTHAELTMLRNRLENAETKNRRRDLVNPSEQHGLSLDGVIQLLLREEREHERRKRESAERRKEAKRRKAYLESSPITDATYVG